METRQKRGLVRSEAWDPLGGNLIFILSPERSGSTMLQLMLESHSEILGLPEPNVMVAVKDLGYYGTAEKTGYETVNQSLGLREFVEFLPRQEEDYLDACRGYAGTLYERALATGQGETYFVDKTPTNALAWEVLVKVFPRAKYIVLVRHPLAIVNSFAQSFFLEDFDRMKGENTRIPEHIKAVADFVRRRPVEFHYARYEDIVSEPEAASKSILEFIGLDYQDAVVEYGSVPHKTASMSDPLTVMREQRPSPEYAYTWASVLRQDAGALRAAQQILEGLSAEDFHHYGYPKLQLLEPLSQEPVVGKPVAPRLGTSATPFYRLQRRLFFALRSLVRKTFLRRVLENTRYYCEVLLRD